MSSSLKKMIQRYRAKLQLLDAKCSSAKTIRDLIRIKSKMKAARPFLLKDEPELSIERKKVKDSMHAKGMLIIQKALHELKSHESGPNIIFFYHIGEFATEVSEPCHKNFKKLYKFADKHLLDASEAAVSHLEKAVSDLEKRTKNHLKTKIKTT